MSTLREGGGTFKADIVSNLSKGGCLNLWTRGGGDKKSENSADVLYGSPQRLYARCISVTLGSRMSVGERRERGLSTQYRLSRCCACEREGRRLNGFLGLFLKDGSILFEVILLDKTVSVGQDSLCIRGLPSRTSAKISDFLTPSPLVRIFTQPLSLRLLTMSAFEGTPLAPSVRTS